MMFGRRGNVMGYMVVIRWLNSRRGIPVNSVRAAQDNQDQLLRTDVLVECKIQEHRQGSGRTSSAPKLAVVDDFQPVRGLALPMPAEITNTYSKYCLTPYLVFFISSSPSFPLTLSNVSRRTC